MLSAKPSQGLEVDVNFSLPTRQHSLFHFINNDKDHSSCVTGDHQCNHDYEPHKAILTQTMNFPSSFNKANFINLKHHIIHDSDKTWQYKALCGLEIITGVHTVGACSITPTGSLVRKKVWYIGRESPFQGCLWDNRSQITCILYLSILGFVIGWSCVLGYRQVSATWNCFQKFNVNNKQTTELNIKGNMLNTDF